MPPEDAPAFTPGLDLAEGLYREVVRPLLDETHPDLPHAAALIGPGSDVLGYDTPMSMDHGWGPRTLLFLSPADHASRKDALARLFQARLPKTFRGHPTDLARPHFPCVTLDTVEGYFERQLGVGVEKDLTPVAWLLIPQQRLRSVVTGRVFHDDLGLEGVRRRLAWYPRDVWLYLLASGWSRIGEDEHLMGRAGFVGDELGSAVLASRLVRDVMRLAFLMERVYAPYAKWFGTAFRELAAAPRLLEPLQAAMRAATWRARDEALACAYEQLARLHNDLGLTESLPATATRFHERPFRVIGGERYRDALRAEIQSEAVRRIAAERLIGNIDFVTDNTDLLEDPARIERLRSLYA